MNSDTRFNAILAICGTFLFSALLGAAVLDSAHKRTVRHACHMTAIEDRYPSADVAVICNTK